MLKNIEAFIFDMDGVFYKGSKTLPGGLEIIDYLKMKDIPFVFFTNNSRKTPEDYIVKLSKLGIEVEVDKILTSGTLAKEFINKFHNNEKIKIFGSKALKSLFCKKTIAQDEEFDIVLVGMEGRLTLDDVSLIRLYASTGKQLIFTNPDKLIPIESGFSFECGAVLSLIKKYCIKEPIIIGKPSKFGFETALNKLCIKKERVAMVGDTYDTDIQGAIDIGITAIHLRTSSNYSYNENNLETYELDNLSSLLEEIK